MKYDEVNGAQEFIWDDVGDTYLTLRERFGHLKSIKSIEGWRYNPRMVR
jgi:hypothetical protein